MLVVGAPIFVLRSEQTLPGRHEQMLNTMMEGSRASAPDGLLHVVRAAARYLDVRVPSMLLVDMEQRLLKPYPGSVITEPQAVDATLPGRAYRLLESIDTNHTEAAVRLFVPLIDSSERLGVLEIEADLDIDEVRAAARCLAPVVAGRLMSQRLYGDAIVATQRERTMRLAAEIQWDLLPPLTLSSASVTIAGSLEPCYEIAGDSFDYALNDEVAHILLLDAMGHGLDSSMIASLAIGAYRNRRRAGCGLVETYEFMDDVVAQRFGPDRFATAQLAEFDTRDGRLRWVNAGHPAAMLVREGRVVGRLDHPPSLPIGFGDGEPAVASVQLQPQDVVLWFSDGVVEARSPNRGFFGEERLADLLERAIASGTPPPEIVRRLTHAVLEHQAGKLQDDATILYFAWPGAADLADGEA